MTQIVASIEISRRPEDVFSYVVDMTHHPEWMEGVVSARPESDAPLAVGSRVLVTRRVGPRRVRYAEELTELHPPRTWANRGVGGIPVTAVATGRVEPLDDGRRSRVTMAVEFQGHGIGRLFAPFLAHRQVKELPRAQRRLKDLLEAESQAAQRPSPSRLPG
jgi:uncharacterized protein YndB with AHSA1/START domain